MKTIIIETQAEFDALPESFSENTIIEIRSKTEILVRRAWGNATVRASGNATVEAWGNATEKAICVDFGFDNKIWLPKSQLEDWPDVGSSGEILMPEWLAKEKDLL